jgi:hypothetical protein
MHYDADYDRIAEVTGQPVEWVVPRGTADKDHRRQLAAGVPVLK